jgi:hypothetical protein
VGVVGLNGGIESHGGSGVRAVAAAE